MTSTRETQLFENNRKNTTGGAFGGENANPGWCTCFELHHLKTTKCTTPNCLFSLYFVYVVVQWCSRINKLTNIKERRKKAQRQVTTVSESHSCDSSAPLHHLVTLEGALFFLSSIPPKRLTQKLRGAS